VEAARVVREVLMDLQSIGFELAGLNQEEPDAAIRILHQSLADGRMRCAPLESFSNMTNNDEDTELVSLGSGRGVCPGGERAGQGFQ
jgi:hypothetical protein